MSYFQKMANQFLTLISTTVWMIVTFLIPCPNTLVHHLACLPEGLGESQIAFTAV